MGRYFATCLSELCPRQKTQTVEITLCNFCQDQEVVIKSTIKTVAENYNGMVFCNYTCTTENLHL